MILQTFQVKRNLILLDDCGNQGGQSKRVIGGSNAGAHTWPWQINLRKFSRSRTKFIHVCGGSIIASRTVLTAAHCVDDDINEPEKFRVR